jgi:hypothetical protein
MGITGERTTVRLIPSRDADDIASVQDIWYILKSTKLGKVLRINALPDGSRYISHQGAGRSAALLAKLEAILLRAGVEVQTGADTEGLYVRWGTQRTKNGQHRVSMLRDRVPSKSRVSLTKQLMRAPSHRKHAPGRVRFLSGDLPDWR